MEIITIGVMLDSCLSVDGGAWGAARRAVPVDVRRVCALSHGAMCALHHSLTAAGPTGAAAFPRHLPAHVHAGVVSGVAACGAVLAQCGMGDVW